MRDKPHKCRGSTFFIVISFFYLYFVYFKFCQSVVFVVVVVVVVVVVLIGYTFVIVFPKRKIKIYINGNILTFI